MYNFEKLTVWQKSMDFCEVIYKESREFPKEEMFGLTSQLRRASTSIPLNISEGSACGTKREFKHFLTIALRSLYEVATAIRLCKRLDYLANESYREVDNSLGEISKLLHGLIKYLKTKN